MKEAKETTDDLFLERVPLMQVGSDGTPIRQISLDLTIKDLSLYWKKKEKILLITILLCSLFFLGLSIVYF